MLYGKIRLEMSLKSQLTTQSFEVTGNVLELPPVREMSKPKSVIESPKKRSVPFLSTSSLSTINRNSTSPIKKPDSSNLAKQGSSNNENFKEIIKQLEVFNRKNFKNIIFYKLFFIRKKYVN
jgi:hypothetical protein